MEKYGKNGREYLRFLWNGAYIRVNPWHVVSITRKGTLLEQELQENIRGIYKQD